MMYHEKKYFFCGVGGSGMSALARVMISKNSIIYGSDRNYDHGRFPELYNTLASDGVILQRQDGSGITDDIDYLVVSSAVEPSIPDVAAAQAKNIPIIKRAELLAEICNAGNSVTIGGTNGKSTVTGMIGWMLSQGGYNPTIINGAGMLNFNRQNAVIGSSERIAVEVDESDGSITNFHSNIAVLTNISEDHKGMNELLQIFQRYLSQSKIQVLNIDCPNVAKLAKKFPDAVTYSQAETENQFNLMVPGAHNRSNAAAAMAVGRLCHMDDNAIIQALNNFKGIASRLEIVGRTDANITVIDDFGHNPDKIMAGLKVLKEAEQGGQGDVPPRLILMYQPHGFAPTRQHKDQLIDVFGTYLGVNDLFYMPEILYFGGTVDQDISSKDIINPLKAKGLNAQFFETKTEIETEILNQAKSGDIICIMGARDDALREMARDLYKAL